MNPAFGYCLDNWKGNESVHENFQWIARNGNVPLDEMATKHSIWELVW